MIADCGRNTPLRSAGIQALPLIAAAIGLGIFVIDTFTTLDIAIAVLYAVVILMAARILHRRGILVVAALCVALTVLGYLVSHGVTASTAVLRGVVSLLAIGIASLLALRNEAATAALVEQARLLDLTHDAILVRDMADVITYWNRGAADLYGWDAHEAVGKTARQLLQTQSPAAVDAANAQVVAAGRWEGELAHTGRDRMPLTVASRWSLQRDAQGRPAAVLETNTDITERIRAEEALQEAQAAEEQRRLTIRSEPHGDHQVLVAMQDAGVGIPPEEANRLFSAFYTTKRNGMGMGLSICRSIIEAHGGRIWAINNEGPGATVQFTVPQARVQP